MRRRSLTRDEAEEVHFLANLALAGIDTSEYEDVWVIWRDLSVGIEVVLMPVAQAPIRQGNLGHGTPEDPLMAYSTGVH
jgi:hypothetical protein